jgi:hypothetical protein
VAAAEPSGPCLIFIGEAFADAISLPRTEVMLETKRPALG